MDLCDFEAALNESMYNRDDTCEATEDEHESLEHVGDVAGELDELAIDQIPSLLLSRAGDDWFLV